MRRGPGSAGASMACAAARSRSTSRREIRGPGPAPHLGRSAPAARRALRRGAPLLFWGAARLTLAETVICYPDWALARGGADGAYASHASMPPRPGGKLTEATVSKVPQRLNRLPLHEPIRRPNARNLGWVTTL